MLKVTSCSAVTHEILLKRLEELVRTENLEKGQIESLALYVHEIQPKTPVHFAVIIYDDTKPEPATSSSPVSTWEGSDDFSI